MIVTALLVDTKMCIPSVFTMSGSSTPLTWTLVPVYDGLDAVEDATAFTVAAKVSAVAVPIASGRPPPKKNPLVLDS